MPANQEQQDADLHMQGCIDVWAADHAGHAPNEAARWPC